MEIVSTMGSGSIGRELDLDEFIHALQDTLEHDSSPDFRDSSMVTVRLEPEGPAYLFYRSGSFQIRGAQTEAALDRAQTQMLDVFEEIDLEVGDYSFEQRTAVFMEDIDRGVDLERLVISLGLEHTEYEPEQFPAAIYKPPAFEVTLLIFSSGKMIVGGTRSEATAREAVEQLKHHFS